MKKIFYLSVILLMPFMCCAQNATSNTYYQKVPKLVPVGDGTYRILEGEYDYVPVNEKGYANPVIVGQKKTYQENAALMDEAARWANGETVNKEQPRPHTLPAQIQTRPVREVLAEEPTKKLAEKSKTSTPYLSLGVSMARSSFSAKEEYGGHFSSDTFSDTTPFMKVAYGGSLNSYLRTEIFYQYRSEVKDEGMESGVRWEAAAKMQDIGLNAFLTLNPASKNHLFVGIGAAATLFNPSYKLNGHDFNDLVDSDLFNQGWFFTPTAFIGLEFPDSSGRIVSDITFFYSKTFIEREEVIAGFSEKLEDVKSYGVSVNIRFNL